MKNKKKFILFSIIIIAVLMLTFFIVNIYAKYLTTATGSTSIPISRWNIKINNLSIKENKNFSSAIVPMFPGNDYIAKNIIAPSAEGYFDLEFDFASVDVSFKYDITTSVSEKSPVQDLVATKYSIDDGDITEFTSPDEHLTDTILYSNESRKRNIRIYIKWNDDAETSTMDNAADTLTTTGTTPAIFNVNVAFTQITE